MRLVLVVLLSAIVLACGHASAQQSPQSYTPQTWTPQTWSPQSHSPPTHAPNTWSPQTGGDTQTRSAPRRRVVKCRLSDEPDDYCSFYSDREFRPGSSCSCGSSRGSTN